MTVAPDLPPGVRAVTDAAKSASLSVAKLGHVVYFFGCTVASMPATVRRYHKEFMRVLADITWGNGSVVVGGGTVGVAMVLGATAGALVGVEGYNALNLLGLGPATGLVSSFVGTRELAPVMVGLAFTTQAGCRFTAQLGAMRINDEIDALDTLGINSVSYLVTTRITAAIVAAVPLFLACLTAAYIACQAVVAISSGQSAGTYLHYFSMFVNGGDVISATVKAAVFVFVASTIQCYYGYFASGGPAGVGVAAGRAMRASITVIIMVNMLMTMALWGVDSGARFGG
ncbi:ABC transporter permease [Mycolicibacterium austroafricanum]|uniref:ABC transporter permease n=1 Tax=Mycolicibacterium austroafricanum TaxID=39687 RepID=UPI00055ECCF8|nr:ABC transporter permease [Mycolicibacterium austroafricanum]QZY47013.1 ABC transporter permease [Mycolicibacterium austroafricanum]